MVASADVEADEKLSALDRKLEEWHSTRLAKRQRMEHESLISSLGTVVNGSLEKRTRVGQVTFRSVIPDGPLISRNPFLTSVVKPCIPPPETSTLADVLHSVRVMVAELNETDVFHSVEPRLEPSASSPSEVDVRLVLREKGRYFVKTSTEVGNNEGSANLTARARNIFGGAESLEINLATGTKTRQSSNATFAVPVLALQSLLPAQTPVLPVPSSSILSLSLFSLSKDLTSYASCMQDERGGRVRLTTGSHQLAAEYLVRNIGGLKKTAGLTIREAAGQSVKTSISHTWIKDTRDDRMAATRGWYAKVWHEIASVSPRPTTFWKGEVETQVSRVVREGLSISLAARTGLIMPLSSQTQVPFPDRFQLGGPLTVRSFKTNGMGERDASGDSVGGTAYFSTGFSVISNLPGRAATWPVKAHGWVNSGALSNSLAGALARPSVSVGLGLIYRFDPIRLEVNFGVPLVAPAGDSHRKGVQVGMGIEFL
ncbi:surface antigen-domain-containing protein [Mycena floridula]|nr:surface antigen-domain-containing protein [Mycena floridula]